MSATNDNLDLSRSNLESRQKGHLRDLGAIPGLEIATGHLPKRFFTTGDDGIAYDTVEEIAHWLVARPHLVEDYQAGMLSLAVTHSRWGDFRGMRETMSYLVDVRIRVAELRGDRHLA